MTLWRKPGTGDVLRYKHGGALTSITHGHLFTQEWVQQYGKDYEFVSVTPIEPPPEPLRRTVYIPVYKTDHYGLIAGGPVHNYSHGFYAKNGEDAKKRTDGFEHRVGIIKVELVEGQYDE